jgi:hypothetical protein
MYISCRQICEYLSRYLYKLIVGLPRDEKFMEKALEEILDTLFCPHALSRLSYGDSNK